MRNAAICIVVNKNNNYWTTKYCIEDFIEKEKRVGAEIYIYGNGIESSELVDYLTVVSNKFILSKEVVSEGRAYSELFELAKHNEDLQVICVYQPDCLVNKSWLFDLVVNNSKVDKSGITAIRTGSEKTEVTALLSESENLNRVWKFDYEKNNGVYVFDKCLITLMELSGIEFSHKEFAELLQKSGYNNYYIPYQSSIKLTK